MKRVTLNPWPNCCEAAFILRDDDICYFTPPHKVEEIYEKAWKDGFKVSLGVIPRVKAIYDPCVPPKFRGKMSQHLISKNHELIEYLKEMIKEGKVDIAQHGFNHEKIHRKPEFQIPDKSEIRARLRAGRKILEECFPNKTLVFIPPWNKVSKQAWSVLKEEGYALIRSEGRLKNLIRNTPLTLPNALLFAKIFSNKVLSPRSNYLAKGVIQFPGMLEFCNSLGWCTKKTVSEFIRRAKERFSMTVSMSGLLCIYNHYWFYYQDWEDEITRKEMLKGFYLFLSYVGKYDVWKTTLSEATLWVRKLSKIRMKVKRKEIILKTCSNLRGLTIKGEDCTLIPANVNEFKLKKKNNATYLVFNKLYPGEVRVTIANS